MDTKARLLDALRAALFSERVGWTEMLPEKQWMELFQLAGVQKILPMVYDAVYQCPGAPLQRVGPHARRQVLVQTIKTNAFLGLYAKLRDAGVRPLVVKGLVCRNLYPKPDARLSGDEDLLILPEQFELADQVLLNAGLERSQSDECIRDSHEVTYTNQDGSLHIELHKSLFPLEPNYGDFNRFFNRIFKNSSVLIMQDIEVLVPDANDHLLYLILHAFVHFLHSGFGIRQVCDICLFANKYQDCIDWDVIHKCLTQVRAVRFAAAVFSIGHSLGITLQGTWPEVDSQPLLNDILSGGIYGATDMERRHSSNITMNAISPKKERQLLRTAFPKARDLLQNYPELTKNKLLLPLVWCKRIWRYRKRSSVTQMVKAFQIGQQRVELLKTYGILLDDKSKQ